MPKQLNTRIQNKYDFEAKWLKVESSYIPKRGEMVIYASEVDQYGNTLTDALNDDGKLPNDRLQAFEYARIKFGDGETTLANLPFVGSVL